MVANLDHTPSASSGVTVATGAELTQATVLDDVFRDFRHPGPDRLTYQMPWYIPIETKEEWAAVRAALDADEILMRRYTLALDQAWARCLNDSDSDDDPDVENEAAREDIPLRRFQPDPFGPEYFPEVD